MNNASQYNLYSVTDNRLYSEFLSWDDSISVRDQLYIHLFSMLCDLPCINMKVLLWFILFN